MNEKNAITWWANKHIHEPVAFTHIIPHVRTAHLVKTPIDLFGLWDGVIFTANRDYYFAVYSKSNRYKLKRKTIEYLRFLNFAQNRKSIRCVFIAYEHKKTVKGNKRIDFLDDTHNAVRLLSKQKQLKE